MTLPKDLPDNYPWLPGSERTPLADLGELAARLGSPVTYDRRGEVLWYDLFGCGYSMWDVDVGTAGTDVIVIAEGIMRAGFGVQLKGRGAGNVIALSKGFGPLYQELIGFEVAVALLDGFNEFRIRILRYDGTNLHRAAIRINDDQDELQYYDSTGSWVKIRDIDPSFRSVPTYHHLKMVVDFENSEYVRSMYNTFEDDLDDIAIRQSSSSLGPYILFQIIYDANNSDDECNLGHAIITANEPKKE